MIHNISNQYLMVHIASKGAQMLSFQDRNQKEYLWQGDNQTWTDTAPNLFPYVGRLTQESYRYKDTVYHMGIHGFAMDSEFEVSQLLKDSITLTIRNNESTRRQYPFSFRFSITYALKGFRLSITYQVENTGGEIMYFGLGGHPGIALPFEKGLDFSDYYITFDADSNPVQIGISDTCFVDGKKAPFPLDGKQRLALSHSLFDHDAIILKNMGTSVTLGSPKGKTNIQISFPQMPYLGIWHWPKSVVDYVCIEPWSSLPSRQDIIEDLSTQKNLLGLKPQNTYKNAWAIQLNGPQS